MVLFTKNAALTLPGSLGTRQFAQRLGSVERCEAAREIGLEVLNVLKPEHDVGMATDMVAARMLISTPCSSERRNKGAAQVLSSMTSTPWACAAAAIAGTSGISKDCDPGPDVTSRVSAVCGCDAPAWSEEPHASAAFEGMVTGPDGPDR
jgi:hypothetical protein